MKRTLLFFSLLIFILLLWHSVPEATAGMESPERLSAPLSGETGRYFVNTFCQGELCPAAEAGRWLIFAEDGAWTVEEAEQVRRALLDVFAALAAAGEDGSELLDGYRFRRYASEYVDGVPGRVARVNHGELEIVLSDTAFLRQQGFYIYHELGHAVDGRLDRRLSAHFHGHTGGGPTAGGSWQTADNFWIRPEGRDDREEAAADAFAVWVMVERAGLRKPVFPGAPMATDHAAIAAAAESALLAPDS